MQPQNNRQRNQEREVSPYVEKVVAIDRVARVVKGGRRFRFRALVVVGDAKGKVGVGLAKGADVTAAVAKATDVAKKNMHQIITVNGTIPHDTYGKVTGSKILIKPASAGTGLIAGGVVRVILEIAGVKNALSKSLGSNNKTNTAYATMDALRALKAREDWVTTRAPKATKVSKAKETK